VAFPSAAHARELLAAAVADGHGGDDYAALIDAAERQPDSSG
jgi:3-hydroxyisobutyrate dehydrogenase-like beta-hydroxyacid dehydrogenase